MTDIAGRALLEPFLSQRWHLIWLRNREKPQAFGKFLLVKLAAIIRTLLDHSHSDVVASQYAAEAGNNLQPLD